jgi:hypothetical protein
MGITYSIMMPIGQRNKRTYEYAPRPKRSNKHKKSRISDTELINPVESTSTKIDDERDTVKVFERNVEKSK